MTAAALALAVVAAILGGLWRIVLGGANRWAARSQSIRWLRWCWDFGHDEPVLRRSIIMAVAPLLCLPAWLNHPWAVAFPLTACATLQWVWPGRDFAAWWSLAGAHGLWAVAAVVTLVHGGSPLPLAFLPLLAPVIVVASYAIGLRHGNDRIGQGASGAAVYGILAFV